MAQKRIQIHGLKRRDRFVEQKELNEPNNESSQVESGLWNT